MREGGTGGKCEGGTGATTTAAAAARPLPPPAACGRCLRALPPADRLRAFPWLTTVGWWFGEKNVLVLRVRGARILPPVLWTRRGSACNCKIGYR